ncbi:hydrolase [Xylaria nigripes]|nr:hydrolase [Xylaria nigripes]
MAMSSADSASAVPESLIAKVTDYVKDYMVQYDASHDFNHIRRVVHLALRIQASTPGTSRDLVLLSALLHDVGDKKYLKPGEDASRLVRDVLTSLGAPAPLADTVQTICLGVSYSGEVRDPARVAALIKAYPELAVVQDADRLDAIGAVGIGRTFTFGGAKGRPLEETMAHFDEKLLRLEGMMKTDAGRVLARERTDRLKLMRAWWADETDGVDDAP